MAAKTGAAHGSHKKTVSSDMSWMRSAACHGADGDLFFGPPGEQRPEREWREARAVKVCFDYCPVRLHCLDYGLTAGGKYGIWGGMNPDERAAERRRRSRRAASGRPVEDIPLPDVEDLASEEAS